MAVSSTTTCADELRNTKKSLKTDVLEQTFLQQLIERKLVDGNGQKSTIFSKEKYDELLLETTTALVIGFGKKKSPVECRRMRRYSILTVSIYSFY